jgi:hypothetical protein
MIRLYYNYKTSHLVKDLKTSVKRYNITYPSSLNQTTLYKGLTTNHPPGSCHYLQNHIDSKWQKTNDPRQF